MVFVIIAILDFELSEFGSMKQILRSRAAARFNNLEWIRHFMFLHFAMLTPSNLVNFKMKDVFTYLGGKLLSFCPVFVLNMVSDAIRN